MPETLKPRLWDAKNRLIALTVFFTSLPFYGAALFSNRFWWDNLYYYTNAGATVSSGRFTLELFYQFTKRLLGAHNNSRVFFGTLALALWIPACRLLCDALCIKSKKSIALLTFVATAFPYTGALMVYSYTAVYYMIGVLLALFAAALVATDGCTDQAPLRVCIASALIAVSMGVYQTNVCVYAAFAFLLAARATFSDGAESMSAFVKRCARCIAPCVFGIALYLLLMRLSCRALRIPLSSYQGLSDMGNLTAHGLLKRAAIAYREFFLPSFGETHSLYLTNGMRLCYWALLALLGAAALRRTANALRRGKRLKGFRQILFLLVAPLAFHSVYLTCDAESTQIHALMMLCRLFPFLALIMLFDAQDGFRIPALRRIGVVLMGLLYLSFGYLTNLTYQKYEWTFEQAQSYYNRLIARIESTPEYHSEMPVAYIGESDKDDSAIALPDLRGRTYLFANEDESVINIKTWKKFMRTYCAFDPVSVADEEKLALENDPAAASMPCYPDDGSIAVLNGVLIVKFS